MIDIFQIMHCVPFTKSLLERNKNLFILTMCLLFVFSLNKHLNGFNPFHSDGLSHTYCYSEYGIVFFVF